MFTIISFERVYTTNFEKQRVERFPSREDAIRYAHEKARCCLENAIQAHIYLAGDQFFQLDVDRTAAGWVAYLSDMSGIRRIA